MKIIGVMGPGTKNASAEDLITAYEVGKAVAKYNAVLLCGAMSGVMEESARGAKELGGVTLGLAPGVNKNEVNSFIDISVMTGMHSGRNFVNICSSDVLIFISVNSPGTLSELAYAIQFEKPCAIISASEKLKNYINEITKTNILFADSIEEIDSFIASKI